MCLEFQSRAGVKYALIFFVGSHLAPRFSQGKPFFSPSTGNKISKFLLSQDLEDLNENNLWVMCLPSIDTATTDARLKDGCASGMVRLVSWFR